MEKHMTANIVKMTMGMTNAASIVKLPLNRASNIQLEASFFPVNSIHPSFLSGRLLVCPSHLAAFHFPGGFSSVRRGLLYYYPAFPMSTMIVPAHKNGRKGI
jgi:hypothetical protein